MLYLNGQEGLLQRYPERGTADQEWFSFHRNGESIDSLRFLNWHEGPELLEKWRKNSELTTVKPPYGAWQKELDRVFCLENYLLWVRSGVARLVGGPTSDEISDFSQDAHLEEKIRKCLTGHKAFTIRFSSGSPLIHADFARFAVLEVMKYKRREQYPAIAHYLSALAQDPNRAEELKKILYGIGRLKGYVGTEFLIFLKHVDTSLIPGIEAGYGAPPVAWIGLLLLLISGAMLLAHYCFSYELTGKSWRFGQINIEFFWVAFVLGLMGTGFFLAPLLRKRGSKKRSR